MENYQKIIADLIAAHMEMMGPNVAVSIAQKISGLKTTATGEVLDGSHDSAKSLAGLLFVTNRQALGQTGSHDKETFEQLRDAYHHFAGSMSEMITKTVLEKHPELKHEI